MMVHKGSFNRAPLFFCAVLGLRDVLVEGVVDEGFCWGWGALRSSITAFRIDTLKHRYTGLNYSKRV